MVPRNTLKWALTWSLAAVWAFAAVPQGGAQSSQSAVSDRRAANSATSTVPGDEPFDSTITVGELFEKAREAFGMDDYDLAEKFYQEILIRERSNVQAMVELANVYERNGKLEYARGLLVRSAKLDASNEAIAERLAAVERVLAVVLSEEVDSLIAASQYELAIPKLSVHISIDPGNPEPLFKRALCYSRLGRPDAALSSIDKALQIDQKEKYYELRSTIMQELKEQEIREMVGQAKALIQSDDAADQRRALGILGEILQIEPEHKWAKSEFLRLSKLVEPGEEEGTEAEGEGLSLRGVSALMARTGRAFVELIRNHLSAILALIIAFVIFRSPVTKLLVKLLAPRPFLSGRFPKFTLTEILVMLNSESHTGILNVKGESCRGKIYFENGEPCHCTVGKVFGVNALHTLLNNTKAGTFEFVDGSIPLNRTMDTPLSVVLAEHASGKSSGAARRKGTTGGKPKKPKSRMKELLESKSRK